jgi:serine protease Do
MHMSMRSALWLAGNLCGMAALVWQPVMAADAAGTTSTISAALMKSVRAATFEVVLPKPTIDPLQYEKPLPLELLPFAERNDKYESIGTAFAIEPGKFVTAAHVTNAASGSMWGAPALRDAQGNVYPIEFVTRFSYDEDFVVFTLKKPPKVKPLPTNTSYQFDTPVIAVGNALGQGIVARDGTLTSETPEDQDGRWKWLRFSAPASPGNSGGPLLDAEGRVIGLISRKSPNENLNYALPIALVLKDGPAKATIDKRFTVAMPFMSAHKVAMLSASFDLPLELPEFDRKLLATLDQQLDTARADLLQESAADLFPRGKSSHLLADTFNGVNPAFIIQQADGHWDVADRANAGTATQIDNDGSYWMSVQAGGPLFRIHYPSTVDVGKSRGDGKVLADLLLKGLKMVRSVGSEQVRITSLGDPGKPEEYKDHHGRVWQQWRYPMPNADATIILAATPVPDGYVGFLRQSKGYDLVSTARVMRVLTDYLETPYMGTLAQWRVYLADGRLHPESFGQWRAALDPGGIVGLQTPRLALILDKTVLNVTDRSVLKIVPGTLLDGDKPAWDVLELSLMVDETPAAARITAVRHAHPRPDAGQDVLTRWDAISQKSGQFAGNPMRDANNFWANRIVSSGGPPAQASFLYQLTYRTGAINVQGEVPRAAAKLTDLFAVLEK